MAGGVRMRWNYGELRAIRKSPEAQRELLRRAQAVADACGGEDVGYVARGGVGKNRARAAVIAASPKARMDNAARNTMLRNLSAGRK